MLLSKKQGKKNKIGALGEDIAVKYLSERGFSVIDRNFTEKWGEIDIIAQKEATIHFVEVKTVSYETKQALITAVTHETWRPEEQYTNQKHQKVRRTAELWVHQKQYIGEYQLDLLAISLVSREKYAEIQYFPAVTRD